MTAAYARGERLSPDERARLQGELAQRYRKGESIRQLQQATGRSYGAIHRMLVDAGVVLRGRGGNTRRSS